MQQMLQQIIKTIKMAPIGVIFCKRTINLYLYSFYLKFTTFNDIIIKNLNGGLIMELKGSQTEKVSKII